MYLLSNAVPAMHLRRSPYKQYHADMREAHACMILFILRTAKPCEHLPFENGSRNISLLSIAAKAVKVGPDCGEDDPIAHSVSLLDAARREFYTLPGQHSSYMQMMSIRKK